MTKANQQGSIVCVGLGMILGSHLGALNKEFIQSADIVFIGASDKLVEMWVESLNTNTHSLQQYYKTGKNRQKTYREMVDAMLNEVRKGKKVVAAFYGHPGVFAWAPHEVIRQARREGYHAHMEPGISAEDCLYADAGIDPASFGVYHVEASQWMLYQQCVDITAYLVLWQIGFVGDLTMSQQNTGKAQRQLLTNQLLQHYPESHQILIYESAVLPTDKTRLEWIALSFLPESEIHHHSTLVIPPAAKKLPNKGIEKQLSSIQNN